MLKHCVGKRPGSVFAPCKNKPVITRNDEGAYWGMWPESEQGLCKRHAQERITKAINTAANLTRKLAKV